MKVIQERKKFVKKYQQFEEWLKTTPTKTDPALGDNSLRPTKSTKNFLPTPYQSDPKQRDLIVKMRTSTQVYIRKPQKIIRSLSNHAPHSVKCSCSGGGKVFESDNNSGGGNVKKYRFEDDE